MAYGTVNADVIGTSVANSNLGAGNATRFKNRLINAGFIINQRGYTSGTSLASGSYGHDRWKGGGSGGTYTFTQGSAGVPIVITITAGSIQQVIEGCNIPDGGTFTLSWTGTAQGRIGSGSYSASPLTVTSQTAGANITVEFNTGTVSYPQFEVGTSATGFDYRDYGTELIMCQRYFANIPANYEAIAYYSDRLTNGMMFLPVVMRTSPTVTGGSWTAHVGSAGTYAVGNITPNYFRQYNSANNWTAGAICTVVSAVLASAEL